MSLGEYLGGWLVFVCVLAGPLVGAWLVVRARMSWMALEARVLAFALLAAGFLFVEHLVPLALGVLTRGTVIAASALVLLAASRVRPAATAEPESPRGASGDAVAWRLGLVVAGAALAYALAFLATNRAAAIADVDATGFHLPVVARWIQDGTLWKLNDFAPGWGFGEYPHTGNVLQLAFILPWHDDFLLRAVSPIFMGLTALGVYALGAELGAPRPAAAIFGALAVAVPSATIVGLNHGQTDMVATFGFATGALFLARHARTGRSVELWLAALGLGLAFGSKWYGPPESAAVILAWIVARGLLSSGRPRWRPAVRDGVLVGVGIVVIGGVWLLVNGALTGDPVFPRRVEPFGLTLFSGARGVSDDFDFALAHYLSDTHLMLHGIGRQLVRSFGAPGGLIVLGTLGAAVAAARARAAVPLAVAMTALLLLAVYVVTPYTAQGPETAPEVGPGVRYALPGLVLGAGACAWLVGRLGRAGIVGAAALALAAMVQGVSKDRTFGVEFRDTTLVRVVVAGVVLALLAGIARSIFERKPTNRAVAVGAAVLAVAVLAAGRDVQTTFDKTRYRVAPVFSWLQVVPPKPIRVGLAGRNGNNNRYSSPYIAFGPRLRNHVEYVGKRRDHMLVPYSDRAGFVAALERGHFNVLVVGPPTRATGEFSDGDPLQWALDAGWKQILRDRRFTLLRPPTG